MRKIYIEQWPDALQTNGGTILDAALKAGVPYPHQCRSGECGECKTRLLSGEVQQHPCMTEALSSDDRENNYILACRCRPKSDISISWQTNGVSNIFPRREIEGTVHSIDRVSRSVVRLLIRCEGEAMDFAAGQYLRLQIADLPARSYSMANVPGSKTIELHIALLKDGRVSNFVANNLCLGDSASIEGPFGFCNFQADELGPIIAAAGGTGLAPIISIVTEALKREPSREVHLYHGARDEADIYAGNKLTWLANQYEYLNVQTVLSQPSQSTSRRTGFVHHAIESDFTCMADASVYAAGPPVMVEAIKTVCVSKGVSENQIHSDSFFTEQNPSSVKKVSAGKKIANLLMFRKQEQAY